MLGETTMRADASRLFQSSKALVFQAFESTKYSQTAHHVVNVENSSNENISGRR